MPYNQSLAARILRLFPEKGIIEKKMFGGVGYMLHKNMVIGIHGDNLIVRVGAKNYQEALGRPGAKPFDMTGRPMVGWVEVYSDALQEDTVLLTWINMAFEFNKALSPK